MLAPHHKRNIHIKYRQNCMASNAVCMASVVKSVCQSVLSVQRRMESDEYHCGPREEVSVLWTFLYEILTTRKQTSMLYTKCTTQDMFVCLSDSSIPS